MENKGEITKVVAERVEQYRNGTPPDNPNHYPPYPDDFPPLSGDRLPYVTVPTIIHHNKNSCTSMKCAA